ncbi:hypothetical protein FDK38_003384 [Candidozyma auris]|nr:hypothetical protein FDK38_003384 [[Candida] auris]
MRSLIKSHRRSDSSTSDSPNGLPEAHPRAPYRYIKTPLASPKVSSGPLNPPHMTPPQQPFGGHQSSKSSPKKLLTPIKKMFGHHSKSSAPPVSGDALHLALAADGPPLPSSGTTRVHALHSPRSMSNLDELSQPQPPPTRPGAHRSHIRHQSTSFLESSACIQKSSTGSDSSYQYSLGKPFDSTTSLGSRPSQEKPHLPIIPDKKQVTVLDTVSGHQGDSDSNISIAKSINFSAKQASSQESSGESFSKEAEEFYEGYSSDNHSDASSQFSFVRDIRGGRNTSVKYYKTKPSRKNNLPEGVQSNTFDVADLGFEDGLSDYDYENNGLDDEEDDYEEFQNKYSDFDDPQKPFNKYEDVLGDEDLKQAISFATGPTSDSQSDGPEESGHSFLDVSQSSGGAGEKQPDHFVTANSSRIFTSPQPEDHTYGDDFLESYLETKSPESDVHSTPHQILSSFGIASSEAPSPLINGVTFGSLDEIRGRKSVQRTKVTKSEPIVEDDSQEKGLSVYTDESPSKEKEEQKRNSIIDLLGSLEEKLVNCPSSEPAFENSVQDSISSNVDDVDSLTKPMVNGLNQDVKSPIKDIDTQSGSASQQQDTRRESVVNMMETLALLANSSEEKPSEKPQNPRRSVAEMMSTLAALDLQNVKMQNEKSPSMPKVSHIGTPPEFILSRPRSYSEDTPSESAPTYHLDDDMLFECNQLPEDYDFEQFRNHSAPESVSDFYRSNSYNKKPKKAVQDNSYRTNKIDTPQRTVTFYRSNSMVPSDLSTSGSLSRNGTVYSATSFTSGEEDQSNRADKFVQKLPYASNANFHLNERSSDCLSHRSFNLEPINESDSPRLR